MAKYWWHFSAVFRVFLGDKACAYTVFLVLWFRTDFWLGWAPTLVTWSILRCLVHSSINLLGKIIILMSLKWSLVNKAEQFYRQSRKDAGVWWLHLTSLRIPMGATQVRTSTCMRSFACVQALASHEFFIISSFSSSSLSSSLSPPPPLVGLGFGLRNCFKSRHSTAWVTSLVHCSLVILEMEIPSPKTLEVFALADLELWSPKPSFPSKLL